MRGAGGPDWILATSCVTMATSGTDAGCTEANSGSLLADWSGMLLLPDESLQDASMP